MKIRSSLFLIFLAVVGAFVGILYTIPRAETATVTFAYQTATEREDGTPLPLDEIKYTRLFCDGEQVAQVDGANGDISAELTGGFHDCYGTHVDTNDVQSNRSNTVTKFVQL